MSYLLKIFPILIFWSAFIYIILYVDYPKSLPSADSFQLLAFFIPLFLALTFTINLLLKFVPSSIFISLGLVLLLILKGLDSLNIVTSLITLIAVVLILSYLKTVKAKLPAKAKTGKVVNFPKKKLQLTKPL